MGHTLDSPYNEIGLSTERRFQLDIGITKEDLYVAVCALGFLREGMLLANIATNAVNLARSLIKEQENGK